MTMPDRPNLDFKIDGDEGPEGPDMPVAPVMPEETDAQPATEAAPEAGPPKNVPAEEFENADPAKKPSPPEGATEKPDSGAGESGGQGSGDQPATEKPEAEKPAGEKEGGSDK